MRRQHDGDGHCSGTVRVSMVFSDHRTDYTCSYTGTVPSEGGPLLLRDGEQRALRRTDASNACQGLIVVAGAHLGYVVVETIITGEAAKRVLVACV